MSITHIQSPIEISIRDSEHIDDAESLQYHGFHDTNGIATIENTGYSAMIKILNQQKQPYVIGGPLPSKVRYIFEQLHFHWAETDSNGCEHSLEGQKYSMEVHLVHFNENYGNFQNATNQPDGLAVIAFFIQASGNQDCKLFQKIIDKLSQIHEPNTKCFLDSDCLSWLLFQELQKHYYTYRGSLTTFPYNECVTWIIYRTPIYISTQQVAAFRELGSCAIDKRKKITKNYRPIQTPPTNQTPKITFTRNARVQSKL